MVSANPDFISYSKIISNFQAAHGRACHIFEILYAFSNRDLLEMFNEHAWKRWYLYKKAIRLIELHFRRPGYMIPKKGPLPESGKRLLRGLIKEMSHKYFQNLQKLQ